MLVLGPGKLGCCQHISLNLRIIMQLAFSWEHYMPGSKFKYCFLFSAGAAIVTSTMLVRPANQTADTQQNKSVWLVAQKQLVMQSRHYQHSLYSILR